MLTAPPTKTDFHMAGEDNLEIEYPMRYNTIYVAYKLFILMRGADMEPMGKEKFFFIVRAIIFFVVFLCFFLVINRVFLYKDNNFYNYVNYMGQPEESVDVLVMGSSHSIDAIDSMELGAALEEGYGIHASIFNMSITSMRIEQIAYRLQEAVKTQSPKLLVIETFSFAPMELSNDEVVRRYALDYIPLSIEKIKFIYEHVDEGKSSFLIPFIKYHTRWGELGKDDFSALSRKWLDRTSSSYGIRVGTKPDYEGERDDYFLQDFGSISGQIEIDSRQKESVDSILETAEKNGITVLFLSVPYKIQMNLPSTELIKYNNYIRENYVDGKNVFLFDMNAIMNSLSWGYEYMQDEGHVNDDGREAVMKYLTEYIGNNLGNCLK